MFLDNDYTKEYYDIVEKNRGKTKGMSIRRIKAELGYTEKHHIIPRSLGGKDLKENTVYLSALDHYRCHQLLVNMTEGGECGKMWSAMWRMMNKQSRNQEREFTFTPKEYELARIAHASAHSKRMSGANNPFYNKKHSGATLKTMSNAKKGKTYEEIFGIDEAKIMRDRRSKERLGIKKGKQDIVECEHCDVKGGVSIMKRWHGDNCRQKK